MNVVQHALLLEREDVTGHGVGDMLLLCKAAAPGSVDFKIQ